VKAPKKTDGVRSSTFDYEGILSSTEFLGKLNDYVKSLESFKPSCLSSDGQLAFWSNAYNALILHFVLQHAKTDGQLPASIKNVDCGEPMVWNCAAGKVDGKELTLEQVEDEARKLGDPRIHAVVNCASLSCPDLRASAYTEKDIQADLDTQAKKWLENPTKGSKSTDDGYLVSPIFQWHSADFADVASFVEKHLELDKGSVSIKGYLEYNWDLAESTSEAGKYQAPSGAQELLAKSSTKRSASASLGIPVMMGAFSRL
jgi:hypothetical protein